MLSNHMKTTEKSNGEYKSPRPFRGTSTGKWRARGREATTLHAGTKGLGENNATSRIQKNGVVFRFRVV